jgi:diguanylate cyclase
VLLSGLSSAAELVPRVSQLLDAVTGPVELHDARVQLCASAGAVLASDDTTIGELLRRGGRAMYQAKRDGSRVVLYSKRLEAKDRTAATLAGDLYRAIENDEIEVLFDPIVDLRTGLITSAEANSRWRHPLFGEQHMEAFIEGMEFVGQLAGFVRRVLNLALAAERRWTAAGVPFPVSINVSARSLLDPGFPDLVAAGLAAAGTPAAGLTLEVNESVLLGQPAVIDDVISALLQIGVRLAIDDFGTGYSSLSNLTRVPAAQLKIHASLVAATDNAGGEIVRAVAELSQALALTAIATGITRPAQRTQLLELGYAAGQGPLFGTALSTDALISRAVAGHGGRRGRSQTQ